MAAAVKQLGGLAVRITGGTDGAGGGDGPVVVLLHGFGAPADDLVPLGDVLGRAAGAGAVRFAFPGAPLSLDIWPGARAWWMIDVGRYERALSRGSLREMADEVPSGLPAAHDKLAAMLDALQGELGVASSRVVLGGFSQGAMLSCDVALRGERPLGGLLLMSGTYVSRPDWSKRFAAHADLPVFQSHGEEDPLLPYELAVELKDAMAGAGMAVDWVSFRGGHEIPPVVLSRAAQFVARVLG